MKYLLLTIITLLIVSCVSSRPCQREELLPEEVALQYFLDTIVPQHDSIFAGKTIVTEGRVYVTKTYLAYVETLHSYRDLYYKYCIQTKKEAEDLLLPIDKSMRKICFKRNDVKKKLNFEKIKYASNLLPVKILSMDYENTNERLIIIKTQHNFSYSSGLVVKNNRVIFHNSTISIDSTYIPKK